MKYATFCYDTAEVENDLNVVATIYVQSERGSGTVSPILFTYFWSDIYTPGSTRQRNAFPIVYFANRNAFILRIKLK